MGLPSEMWDDTSSRREHCYRARPHDIATDPRKMVLEGVERVCQAIVSLGYKLRDAGGSPEFAYVSLNKQIRPEHLARLERELDINPDSGDQLGFC